MSDANSDQLARAALLLLGRLLQNQTQQSLDSMTNGLSDQMLGNAVDIIKNAAMNNAVVPAPETLYAYASILSPGHHTTTTHLGHIKRDDKEADELYSLAAQQGNLPVAALAIARRPPIRGTPAEQPWLELAADAQIPLAQTKLDLNHIVAATDAPPHAPKQVPTQILDRLSGVADDNDNYFKHLPDKDKAGIALTLAEFFAFAPQTFAPQTFAPQNNNNNNNTQHHQRDLVKACRILFIHLSASPQEIHLRPHHRKKREFWSAS